MSKPMESQMEATVTSIACATPNGSKPAPKGKPEGIAAMAAKLGGKGKGPIADGEAAEANASRGTRSVKQVLADQNRSAKPAGKLPVPGPTAKQQAASAAPKGKGTAKAKPAPKGKGKPDDGIPENLRVENRKPPTAAQQKKIDAAAAKAKEQQAEQARKTVGAAKTPKAQPAKAAALPEKATQPRGAFTPEIIEAITALLKGKDGVSSKDLQKKFRWNGKRVARYMRTVAIGRQKMKLATEGRGDETVFKA